MLKNTLPFASDCEPGGLVVDLFSGTAFAASRTAGAVMVASSTAPYIGWTDITENHGAGVGVTSIIVL